jgi:glutamate/tyrosine decarboxylase-like PLP-dependent enzyme
MTSSYEPLLTRVHAHASEFLRSVATRPVDAAATFESVLQSLGDDLPESSQDPADVVEQLVAAMTPGLVAVAGPRYFGFVIGGSFPAALAADWLVSTWDQNCALHVMSPAVSALETCAARWLLDILGLPQGASVGFVTGAHMANVTALAAARHDVLRRAGWDVEAFGLHGAPVVTVIAGEEAHASIHGACRMIGIGSQTIVRIPADDQGRMKADGLERALSTISGPAIVCAQAGNVNTGACDPLMAIVQIAHARGAWVHVDGAFGLWAAASPSRRALVEGVAGADSWATDAHKWLNVPYDSGITIVRHPAAHRAAMSQTAAYLTPAEGEQRDGADWVPEASRRARAVPIYVVLRTLGRAGVADLVDRCCHLATRMADRLRPSPRVTILNDVRLNQVLVRFTSLDGGNVTPAVIAAIQRAGVCWCGGTTWQGQPAMRISVSNWRTSDEDIDRSAASILQAL